jgi:hypothetical protein
LGSCFFFVSNKACFSYSGLSNPSECIEGHITIIAGFGTLRTQPAKSYRGLSGPPWADCIEGHI